MPDYTLYQGDCLEIMPTLEKSSVACVFADLPYHAARHLSWDRMPFDVRSFENSSRPLMLSKSLYVLTANMRFAGHLLEAMSTTFRHDLVWHKQCPSNIFAAKRQPLSYHEHVLVFSDTQHTYNPQMLDESQRGQVLRRVRTLKAMQKKFYGNSKEERRLVAGPLYPRSVLLNVRRDALRRTLHPTQKPVALLEWLIATYTNPGDTVLDPCFGSNSTGVACARLGRRYIGIEKDATYFAAGKARLEAELARLAEQPAQGSLAV